MPRVNNIDYIDGTKAIQELATNKRGSKLSQAEARSVIYLISDNLGLSSAYIFTSLAAQYRYKKRKDTKC